MKLFNLNKVSIVISVILLLIVMSGCREQIDEDHLPRQEKSEEVFSVEENAYPIERSIQPEAIEDAYPAGDQIDEFDQSSTAMVQGPDFSIEKPVTSGDEKVSGSGPADVPIALINLSNVDEIIGETTISSQGIFIFELANPLVSGQSIGIKLGDISGTRFNENEFVYNESYYSRPYVGILFDIAYVE